MQTQCKMLFRSIAAGKGGLFLRILLTLLKHMKVKCMENSKLWKIPVFNNTELKCYIRKISKLNSIMKTYFSRESNRYFSLSLGKLHVRRHDVSNCKHTVLKTIVKT